MIVTKARQGISIHRRYVELPSEAVRKKLTTYNERNCSEERIWLLSSRVGAVAVRMRRLGKRPRYAERVSAVGYGSEVLITLAT